MVKYWRETSGSIDDNGEFGREKKKIKLNLLNPLTLLKKFGRKKINFVMYCVKCRD